VVEISAHDFDGVWATLKFVWEGMGPVYLSHKSLYILGVAPSLSPFHCGSMGHLSPPKNELPTGRKPKIATVREPTFWEAKNVPIWDWTEKSNGGSIGRNLGANLGAIATPKAMGKPSFNGPENQ
jgi:hypothetical protein